jgi:hypothetical protein
VRPINGGGFKLMLGGPVEIVRNIHSHEVRIRGQQGGAIVVTVCPPDDPKSREGILIPLLPGHHFTAEGCNVKRWNLPRKP